MNSLTNENTRLGFIGIGNMGSRMAKRLIDHGYQLVAYNRSREAAEALVKYGATVADSIAELAAEADVILSSLTNDEAVKSVYTDPKGVFAHLRRASAVIEMSTVLPATSRQLYELSREAGVRFLDSPVSGSTPSAEEGTLTLFCGGDEELFQAAQPIFSSIAGQNFYLGGSGSGTATKLVANTLLGVGMQAIAESVALGQKEGLDRHRLLEVLSHTAVIAPAHLGKLTRADAGDYTAQFAIRLMNKDFGLVLKTRGRREGTDAGHRGSVSNESSGIRRRQRGRLFGGDRVDGETGAGGNVTGRKSPSWRYAVGLDQVLDVYAGSSRISLGSSPSHSGFSAVLSKLMTS